MIEAVIFDMDGVLADTEYYYENRRKNFLLENGIPIPEGNFIGSNEKAIWEAIVPNDPVRRQEMLMAYRAGLQCQQWWISLSAARTAPPISLRRTSISRR